MDPEDCVCVTTSTFGHQDIGGLFPLLSLPRLVLLTTASLNPSVGANSTEKYPNSGKVTVNPQRTGDEEHSFGAYCENIDIIML